LYLVSNPRAGAVAALEANEALFGALVRAVFTPRVVLRAAELVVNYVNGFAPGEAEGPLAGPGEREWFRALLEAQPADKFPALHRAYDGVTEAGSRSDFEYGLGVILVGLEASRIRGGRGGPLAVISTTSVRFAAQDWLQVTAFSRTGSQNPAQRIHPEGQRRCEKAPPPNQKLTPYTRS
jgi:hypothetical protein